MPAYNAQSTIKQTFLDIPSGAVDEVILGDDASSDNTVAIAQSLGMWVLQHKENKGYGANQKTCYQEALKRGAEIVVMIHPDYQYDSRLVPYLTGLIRDGICDVMIGTRIRTRKEALAGGMPKYKYIGNRFLTFIENIILGQNLSEFHSGFRAFHRRVLEKIPFSKNSDDFVFDSEILAQSVVFNFKIGEIPVPTRYFKEASTINFINSVVYGIKTLFVLVKFLLHKWRIKKCRLFLP
ncbi:glycosyltransferase family 2 protein [bacterium]|nr:glycosyltransferase family 2 protein [bacterium]